MPATASEVTTSNSFADYHAIAGEYGRGVNNKGEIIHKDGRLSGVFLVIKKGRLIVQSASGDKLSTYPAQPESLGRFLESFWFATKAKV